MATAASIAKPAAEAEAMGRAMLGSNVQFHEAVQLIYADARRRVEEAWRVDEAAEPYRLLTYALETAYPENIMSVDAWRVDAKGKASLSEGNPLQG